MIIQTLSSSNFIYLISIFTRYIHPIIKSYISKIHQRCFDGTSFHPYNFYRHLSVCLHSTVIHPIIKSDICTWNSSKTICRKISSSLFISLSSFNRYIHLILHNIIYIQEMSPYVNPLNRFSMFANYSFIQSPK